MSNCYWSGQKMYVDENSLETAGLRNTKNVIRVHPDLLDKAQQTHTVRLIRICCNLAYWYNSSSLTVFNANQCRSIGHKI